MADTERKVIDSISEKTSSGVTNYDIGADVANVQATSTNSSLKANTYFKQILGSSTAIDLATMLNKIFSEAIFTTISQHFKMAGALTVTPTEVLQMNSLGENSVYKEEDLRECWKEQQARNFVVCKKSELTSDFISSLEYGTIVLYEEE